VNAAKIPLRLTENFQKNFERAAKSWLRLA